MHHRNHYLAGLATPDTTTPFARMDRARPGRARDAWPLRICAVVAATLAMAACSDPPSSAENMVLDLETLEAGTEFGTLEAWRLDSSFVGPLDDGRVIGVALLHDLGNGEEESGHAVVAYVYEGENLAVLTGEVDSDGVGTLQSGELSDFEATVEVMLEDGAVTGTATLPGERTTTYRADAATGVGGVYWAEGTDAHPDVSADWIVLPDERQWGCICFPPYTSPCCQMRF